MSNTVGILAILATVALLADYLTTMRGLAIGMRETGRLYRWTHEHTGWSTERALHTWIGIIILLVWLLAALSPAVVAVPILAIGGAARAWAAWRNWQLLRGPR